MEKYKRTLLWVLVNAAALPFASWAVLLIVGGIVAGGTYSGFDLEIALQCLPVVMAAGAVCGAILGLVQGWALRGYGMTVLDWTVVTAIGMSVDFAIVNGTWLTRTIGSPFAPRTAGEFFIEGVFWVLVFTHGCSLAAVQSVALRRRGRRITAWPWLVGIAWSVLTPFLLVLQISNGPASEPPNALVQVMGDLIWLLPSLLLALPYILVTAYLLERYCPPEPPRIQWQVRRFVYPPAIAEQPNEQKSSQETP